VVSSSEASALLDRSEQPNCLGQSEAATQGNMVCLAQEAEILVRRSWSIQKDLHEHGSVMHDNCQSGG